MSDKEKQNIKYRLSDIGEKVGELALNYIENLEKENAKLKAQIESPCTGCQTTESLEEALKETDYQVVNQDAEIRQLKEQIEKMKCCGNCKHCYMWEDFYINMNCELPNTDIDLENKCDKWELAE